MTEPIRQPDFVTWKVDAFPAIVCSQVVLGKLAQLAMQSAAGTNGAGDVGGVLFGRIDGGEMRVTASRPIPCEHASGPDFVLSDNDEIAIQYQLRAYRDDASLRDLEPVGWYRSRRTGGVFLSPEDVSLWKRYFARNQQVVLVLHPQDEIVRAGFFFRPKTGQPRTDRSMLEFRVGEGIPLSAQVPMSEPESQRNMRSDQSVPYDSERSDVRSEDQPPEEIFQRPQESSKWKVIVGVAAGLMLAVAGGWWFFAPPPIPPDIGFRLTEQNGQLRALWDANAPVLTGAGAGTLTVQDGPSQVSSPITAAALRNGVMPIARVSGDVRVRLEFKAYSGDAVVTTARFLADVPQVVPSLPVNHPLMIELARLQTEHDAALRDKLSWQQKLDDVNIRIADSMAAAAAARAAAVKPPASPSAPATPTALAAVPPPATVAGRGNAPPSQAPVAVPPPAIATTPVATAVATPVAAIPEPVVPTYNGPRSGKIIWQGFLGANATLSIEGRRPSVGQINGAFPGVPVRVSVYPAELTGSGLSVYSASQRGSAVEPKSAQSGWMEIRHVVDAARARDLQLTQTPSEANRNQSLHVRAGQRSLTALVIEWEVER